MSAVKDTGRARRIAYMETLTLLLIHCLLLIFFGLAHTWFMFAVNCVSVPIYMYCFYLIHRKKYTAYIVLSYAEITVHMIAAIICLGWSYGFQLYCFAFIPALYYQYYIIGSEKQRRLPNELMKIGIMIAVFFIVLKVYTYAFRPLYSIRIPCVEQVAFVVNTMIAFGFIIFYQFHYLSVVSKSEFALKIEADYDGLTRTYNRRRMEFLLEELYSKAKSGWESFSISILDIDDFKAVNDTYGHEAGDYVLRSMANVLQYTASKEEQETIIGRWGGEEFLILQRFGLYGKGSEETLERFRKEINANRFQYNKRNIAITVTIGTAEFNPQVSIHDMIKQADKNLYQGKHQGKNQVVA